jgi:hypothetical protein
MTEPASHDRYAAFGLLWESPDLALEELPMAGVDSTGAATIRLRDETGLAWPDLLPGPLDTDTLQMGPADLRFRVEGTGRFRIWAGERIAWQRQEGRAIPREEICTYLLGAAAAALLIQRGMLVLHGNALVKDGKAIVCLGRSGAGKSTLAYSLMRQGWQVLADDLVAISHEGLVLPGIPRIKLWHDAVVAFGLDPAELPPIHRRLRKYAITGAVVQRAPEPTPLKAIYLIGAATAQEQQRDPEGITWIQSEKAAAELLRSQTFHPRFVQGLGQEGGLFLATAQLQARTPVAHLPLPRGIDRLENWLHQNDLLHAAANAQGRQDTRIPHGF